MKDVSGLFWWCNGGHYVEARHGGCPWSGYSNRALFRRLQRVQGRGAVRNYQELLTAGVAEEHLLHLLLVPPERARIIASVRCGEPAPGELADLVAQRNRLVLEFFPQGKLRALLDCPAPQSEYWYARRPSDEALWVLVDESGFHRRSSVSRED